MARAPARRAARQRAPEVPPAAAGADRISRRAPPRSTGGEPRAVARLNGKLELLAEPHRRRRHLCHRPGRRDGRGEQLAHADQLRRPELRLPPLFPRCDARAAPPSCSRSARSAAAPASIWRGGSRAAAGPLGVVVVKVEFDAVEAPGRAQPGASFVTDAHGVILVTSLAGLAVPHDRRLDPAASPRRSARSSSARSRPGRRRSALAGRNAVATIGGAEGRYRLQRRAAPLGGRRLYHIAPLDAAARGGADRKRCCSAWPRCSCSASSAGIVLRSRREKRRSSARRARALEQRGRAAHRRAARGQRAPARQRIARARPRRPPLPRRARGTRPGQPARHRSARSPPASPMRSTSRSPRSAPLPRMPASCSSAASRERARDNLARIVELTDRIGAITAELRGFARRGAPAIGAVDARRGARRRAAAARRPCARDRRDRRCATALRRHRGASPTGCRLEQILVNLLQNALDAHARDGPARESASAPPHGDEG